MANIEKAQQARAAQALSKLIRYKGAVMTITAYLQELKNEGLTPSIGTTGRLQYSRTKYNRMTCTKEQDEYLRKCDEQVTEYRANDPAPSTSFYVLTKTQYDYFTSLFD